VSYSRWGGGSRWYTFWACQDEVTENRETCLFEICPVVSFTAAGLRADIEACLDQVAILESGKGAVSDTEREELRGYIMEFLADVDCRYPEVAKVNGD